MQAWWNEASPAFLRRWCPPRPRPPGTTTGHRPPLVQMGWKCLSRHLLGQPGRHLRVAHCWSSSAYDAGAAKTVGAHTWHISGSVSAADVGGKLGHSCKLLTARVMQVLGNTWALAGGALSVILLARLIRATDARSRERSGSHRRHATPTWQFRA